MNDFVFNGIHLALTLGAFVIGATFGAAWGLIYQIEERGKARRGKAVPATDKPVPASLDEVNAWCEICLTDCKNRGYDIRMKCGRFFPKAPPLTNRKNECTSEGLADATR